MASREALTAFNINRLREMARLHGGVAVGPNPDKDELVEALHKAGVTVQQVEAYTEGDG